MTLSSEFAKATVTGRGAASDVRPAPPADIYQLLLEFIAEANDRLGGPMEATQTEMVDHLASVGYECTRSTVNRAIQRLVDQDKVSKRLQGRAGAYEVLVDVEYRPQVHLGGDHGETREITCTGCTRCTRCTRCTG